MAVQFISISVTIPLGHIIIGDRAREIDIANHRPSWKFIADNIYQCNIRGGRLFQIVVLRVRLSNALPYPPAAVIYQTDEDEHIVGMCVCFALLLLDGANGNNKTTHKSVLLHL